MHSGILEDSKVLAHRKLEGESSSTVKKFDQVLGMLTCKAEVLLEERNLAHSLVASAFLCWTQAGSLSSAAKSTLPIWRLLSIPWFCTSWLFSTIIASKTHFHLGTVIQLPVGADQLPKEGKLLPECQLGSPRLQPEEGFLLPVVQVG